MPFDPTALKQVSDGAWSTEVLLQGAIRPVEMTIACGPAGLTPVHVRAAQQFVDGWPTLYEALRPALFAYYCKTESLATDTGPIIDSPSQVWEHAFIRSVEVAFDERNGNGYAHLAGICSWEIEHGLEMGVRNGRELMYVGPFEDQGCDEPPLTHEWNFADPVAQATAIAERAPSQAEIDELAQSYTAESNAAEHQLTKKKPWWKW